MSLSSANTFSLILLPSTDINKNQIANTFAKLFNIEEDLALQIVDSAPISILVNLEKNQAEEIITALAPLIKAGAKLDTKNILSKKLPQVSWPEEPLIAGITLAEYHLPANCNNDKAEKTFVCCPECGVNLQLSLASQDIPPEDTKQQITPGSTPLPEEKEFDELLTIASNPNHKVPVPASEETFFKPVPPPPPQTCPQKKRDSAIISRRQSKTNKKTTSGSRHSKPDSVRNKKRIATKIAENPVPQDKTQKTQSREPTQQHKNTEPAYNIFASHTNNPEIIPMLMKIRNISQSEAKKLAQKTIIPVAKNLTKEVAEQLQKQFIGKKISIRITRKI